MKIESGKAQVESEATSVLTPLSYDDILRGLIASGWKVTTEGQSGAQLGKPRVMRMQTKIVLAIGIVGIAAMGIGLLFVVIALIDYYSQKEGSYFLSRANPEIPKKEGPRKTPMLIKVLLGIVLALVAFAIIGGILMR